MNISVRSAARVAGAGLRALLVLTVVCGVIYPLVVTGLAQLAFHDKANGSEVKVDGKSVGSALLGQSYTLDKKDKDGNPLPDPKFFQPRPSAAGPNAENTKYHLLVSGASNLAADSKVLLEAVEKRRADVASFNGVSPSEVPVDALTASASGVDPDISPAYARLQAARVARANGLSAGAVERLVKDHTDGRQLGFMGDEHVNVLKLNVALKELAASR
ncbi:potassium-transporting ATPase subunit KdpC [Streptomyces mobaraensis NBRC 13819 = DSM 40847]|uniref:Potassium-transporting ATPase KdpC subunit n=2 Tax=Streptomyces mobaraensis TaxID=35621 RepID=A0A5N5W7J3_STRMB|nr:potassium-transporting ATPase subunit KdpC [Streptomyces mobaraensis]EME98410.1 potassium-transporting ATPase subunit C [Streptomyces mobaraensis NBRC 13819 = DSM 40847]KAB7844414.1 potassium-transporting ATPase subunit KdpC [Streptomyces mobaraensis]QTT76133.1 potassium-transporting ATPase subunit KdpC [Streptomyces mobaraensis NBRC 13819 = DSM 40847]